MLEVTEQQLADLQAIERLSRRISACSRVLACLRRRTRLGANTRAATARMTWQYRRLNDEFMERLAKLKAEGTKPSAGDPN